MTNLIIQLDPNPQGHYVFYPGHLLNGVVELSLNEVKKFRGCYVVVYGYARAHWTETRTSSTGSGKNRRTTHHTVHYEGKQVFINSKTYLFGHDGAQASEVQPGVYRYNFNCQLPDMIPATMDGAHGNIAYYVEATLDIPWRFDKEFKTSFTVARIDDLRIYPELRMAQQMEKIKKFCCLFCQSEPLFMSVTVPNSGFARESKIPIHIRYDNRSNVPVTCTMIKLKRAVHFTSYTPSTKTRSDRDVVVQIREKGVAESSSVDIHCKIEIPGILMNSNARFCHVVRVEYYLKIEGEVADCHKNPSVEIPIVIGNIGFETEENGFIPLQSPSTVMPTAPPSLMPSAPPSLMPTAPPSLMPSAPSKEQDDLPPSFDEAINMIKPDATLLNSSFGWNVQKQ